MPEARYFWPMGPRGAVAALTLVMLLSPISDALYSAIASLSTTPIGRTNAFFSFQKRVRCFSIARASSVGTWRSMKVASGAGLVLVFDIGTSSLRTALFTSPGERVLEATAQATYPLHTTADSGGSFVFNTWVAGRRLPAKNAKCLQRLEAGFSATLKRPAAPERASRTPCSAASIPPAAGFSGCEARPRNPKKSVFDFRAHFGHSAPMETHTFGFKLVANAPGAKSDFLSVGGMRPPILL